MTERCGRVYTRTWNGELRCRREPGHSPPCLPFDPAERDPRVEVVPEEPPPTRTMPVPDEMVWGEP